MNLLKSSISAGQAIVLGVVIVGCATAATITGHLSGADLLVVLGTAGGVAGGVTGAHVGATAATNAVTATTGAAPTGVAEPPPPVAAAPTPAPVQAVQ